jgi:predicted permease
MASILLLFICLLIGYLLKRYRLVGANSFEVLNTLIIYVALPALTLQYIPNITINIDLIFPVLMAWINIVVSWMLFGFLGRKLGWSRAITGALIIMAGFGNTSFVGIPIIQALYGKAGIETVILIDQPGSFVALTTLGIFIANIYSDKQKPTAGGIFKNIIKFPPFIAFVIGVVLNVAGIAIATDINTIFETLGGLVVPLALISVGMQLELDFKSVYWKYIWMGLGFKLLLFPAIIFVLYFILLQQSGQVIEITLIEAAMAPMITAGIVASSYNLKPRFCSLILSVGIFASFITIPFWYWVVRLFG